MWGEKVKKEKKMASTLTFREATKDQKKSAKADVTFIMKTNWIVLSLLGSMGILGAFLVCVCVCEFLFLPAHKINGHYHESSSHRD